MKTKNNKTVGRQDRPSVLKKVKTSKHYYHLTNENWGNKVVLKPRIEGERRDLDFEPSVPRICVSSSIEGCFVSIYLNELNRYKIYRTKNKVIATKPFEILDSHITEEHWLNKPTEFILLGELEHHFLEDILKSFDEVFYSGIGFSLSLGDGNKKSENWQKKAKIKVKKIIKKHLKINKLV